jgi:hypothetical protein
MKIINNSVALAGAVLLGLALTGCGATGGTNASANVLGVGSSHTKTAPPSATPTAIATSAAIGSTLTKSQALNLRDNMPDNGDYAYQLKDGTWIATNIHQPLPAAAQSELNAQAATIPSDNVSGTAAMNSLQGSAQYSTGKSVAVVARIVAWNGSSNALTWAVIGAGVKPSGAAIISSTQAGEIANVQAAIVASGDSLNDWVIIVQP